MRIHFEKYHGTGNDFILIDNRDLTFPHAGQSGQQIISRLCNRHLGVGADGLILVEPDRQTDFRMRFFNADGLPGSFCGNGSRCAIAFIYQNHIVHKEQLHFSAADGIHQATVMAAGDHQVHVRISLMDVTAPDKIQAHEPFDRIACFVDTGSPHVVIFAEKIDDINVAMHGRRIRNDVRWQPQGVNVNFVENLGNGNLYVRTFERGVENETLSCGSGVTAVAIAAHHMNVINKESLSLLTKGGELHVSFAPPAKGTDKYTGITLEGPAAKVYSGEISQMELDQ